MSRWTYSVGLPDLLGQKPLKPFLTFLIHSVMTTRTTTSMRTLSFHFNINIFYQTQVWPLTAIYPGIDGEWQEWGEWSHCDPSCSCAKKFRYRACTTAPLFGGNDCVGDPTETAPCSDSGCCSSTVSRIRTLDSLYHPSCQNTTSLGKFRLFWFWFQYVYFSYIPLIKQMTGETPEVHFDKRKPRMLLRHIPS